MEEHSKVALIYDFDGTLSPGNMQEFGFIQAIGKDKDEFWAKNRQLSEENDANGILCYMYLMLQAALQNNISLKRESFRHFGSKIELYEGVKGWFKLVGDYGRSIGLDVRHYINSSGLKEMIEGTEMAKEGAFTKIYASAFMFDDKGVAVWPAQAINYTNKTQFLFRIQKGILDINDTGVNEYVKPEDQRVPFRNMIYIGDSDTDIPCMSLVNANGGHSIGVYDPVKKDKDKVYKMMRHHRIRYYAPADYTNGSKLDTLVKQIIRKTAAYEVLEGEYVHCKHEAEE